MRRTEAIGSRTWRIGVAVWLVACAPLGPPKATVGDDTGSTGIQGPGFSNGGNGASGLDSVLLDTAGDDTSGGGPVVGGNSGNGGAANGGNVGGAAGGAVGGSAGGATGGGSTFVPTPTLDTFDSFDTAPGGFLPDLVTFGFEGGIDASGALTTTSLQGGGAIDPVFRLQWLDQTQTTSCSYYYEVDVAGGTAPGAPFTGAMNTFLAANSLPHGFTVTDANTSLLFALDDNGNTCMVDPRVFPDLATFLGGGAVVVGFGPTLTNAGSSFLSNAGVTALGEWASGSFGVVDPAGQVGQPIDAVFTALPLGGGNTLAGNATRVPIAQVSSGGSLQSAYALGFALVVFQL